MTIERVSLSCYELALRYVGVKEIAGEIDNPLVLSMLRLDDSWPESDEVPWCSAFVNWIVWHLRLPRSKSLRARSWLLVGLPTSEPIGGGNDVCILRRGNGNGSQGPDVIEAPGHVGFFAGWDGSDVLVLGGNQSDSVNISRYPGARVLGFRRLL